MHLHPRKHAREPARKEYPPQVIQASQAAPLRQMTSQGTTSGRFIRAIQRRNVFQAELALREMGTPSLLVALNYLGLVADVKPEKFPSAAVRWHGRLEETPLLTFAESSQYALAALGALGEGQHDAIDTLRKLLRKARPTLIPRVS